MPISNAGRQEKIAAVLTFKLADFVAGEDGEIKLPEGAIVTSAGLAVSTAVAGDVGVTLAVSGGGITLGATSCTAADYTAATVDGSKVAAGGETVAVTMAGNDGTATAGEASVIVEYVVQGRAAFSEG